MLTNLYYLHGILLPSGKLITELSDCTPQPNIQELVGYAGGNPVPQFRGGHGAAPAVEFTTPMVKSILDVTGMHGANLDSGNVDLFYRVSTTRAGRGSTGIQLRAVRSFLNWSEIAVRQGQSATIRCRLVPCFDGTNPPLVPSAGAVAASQSADEFFGVGPVKLNNSTLVGVEGWTLSLDPSREERARDGDDYPSFAGVNTHNPVLTVNTDNLAYWTTIGVGGLAITSLVAYLRRRDLDTGLGVPKATATHISLTATAGMASLQPAGGGGEQASTIALRCGLRAAAPTDSHAVTLNTAVAIT